MRAGNVLVANAPGSAFLESTALLGFLPALSRHLLGEELSLPSLPPGGAASAPPWRRSAAPAGPSSVIKPTYPGRPATAFRPCWAARCRAASSTNGPGRIVRQGDEHTVQAYLPLSQMPTWKWPTSAGSGRIVPRSVMLRVFAVSDGRSPGACCPAAWRALPAPTTKLPPCSAAAAAPTSGC
jgi:uncharacterized circularly permuted ATP-grasp superfamily protein